MSCSARSTTSDADEVLVIFWRTRKVRQTDTGRRVL